MVMQVEQRELYWFGLSVPYVQCESRSLYCLAPESACNRAVQAGRERGLNPKSRLCVVDRVILCTLGLYVRGLALCSNVVSWMCALAPLL